MYAVFAFNLSSKSFATKYFQSAHHEWEFMLFAKLYFYNRKAMNNPLFIAHLLQIIVIIWNFPPPQGMPLPMPSLGHCFYVSLHKSFDLFRL